VAIADPDLVSFSDGPTKRFCASGVHGVKDSADQSIRTFTAELSVIVHRDRSKGRGLRLGWHDYADARTVANRFVAYRMWILAEKQRRSWKLGVHG